MKLRKNSKENRRRVVPNKNKDIFTAYDGEEIAGWLHFSKYACDGQVYPQIERFQISSIKYYQKGFGRLLIETAVTTLREQEIKYIFVHPSPEQLGDGSYPWETSQIAREYITERYLHYGFRDHHNEYLFLDLTEGS